MKKMDTRFLVESAIIGAIYVVITLMFAPISFGEVQIRISEALTILPFFTPAAVPGLFIGCIISNIIGGGIPFDIFFGSIATLLGAIGTYKFRSYKLLLPIWPILSNTLIIPFVLHFGYGINLPIPFLMVTIALGEVISCGVLGMMLWKGLSKYAHLIFYRRYI